MTTTWAIVKQYLGNNILLIENILCMLKCLSASKYIRITMYGGITMIGWKYDAHIKVRPMQRWSGGGGRESEVGCVWANQLPLISQMLVVTYLQLRHIAVPTLELKINGETQDCLCLPRPRSPWFKEGRRWQRGSSSAGRVCHQMLEKGATS